MQSVASATVTPASSRARASGYGWRVENSTPGSSVATVEPPARASTSVGREVGAVVDARRPQLDGEPHPRPRPELVAVDPQTQPGRPAREQDGAGLVLREGIRAERVRRRRRPSVRKREPRASIGPVTSSTYSARRERYSGGTTWPPRKVTSSVTSRARRSSRVSVADVQAVARLHLDDARALRVHLGDPVREQPAQLVVGRRRGSPRPCWRSRRRRRPRRSSGRRTPRCGRRRRPGACGCRRRRGRPLGRPRSRRRSASGGVRGGVADPEHLVVGAERRGQRRGGCRCASSASGCSGSMVSARRCR